AMEAPMNRARLLGLALLLLAGCRLTPERQSLQLLPEGGLPLPYTELVKRARDQASAANEAFYVDRWLDLEDAAKALEQTARFLPKATEIPAKQKDKLEVEAGDLGKDAGKLRDAAKTKDVKQANESLQRIHLQIRKLRPEL